MEPTEVVARPLALTPRLLAEVRGLHDRTERLARDGGKGRGRQARRERRDAREAENDLLRVLGFASYAQFAAAVGEAPREATDPVVDVERSAPARDPKPGDGSRLPVSRNGVLGPARPDQGRRNGALRRDAAARGGVEDLHSRVAAAEEELAEARFELRNVRDELRGLRGAPAPPEVDGGGLTVPAAADLAEAARELRALCELLREERAELAALGERGRAEAERIVAQARLDAQREREEAAIEASALFARARAEASALTRNAVSTVEGLRRLALEAGSGDSEAAEPRTAGPADGSAE